MEACTHVALHRLNLTSYNYINYITLICYRPRDIKCYDTKTVEMVSFLDWIKNNSCLVSFVPCVSYKIPPFITSGNKDSDHF